MGVSGVNVAIGSKNMAVGVAVGVALGVADQYKFSTNP